MKALKYRVTVEFTVPADDPSAAQVKLDSLKSIGDLVKVQASATKSEKSE
jgi:hypothetical protein